MLELVPYLLLALAVVAVVGHGIWVTVGLLLRLVFNLGASRAQQSIEAWLCPRCGEMLSDSTDRGPCPLCSWSADNPHAPPPSGRPAALRRLRGRVLRFVQLGLIPEEIGRAMIQSIPAELLQTGDSPSWGQATQVATVIASAPASAPEPPTQILAASAEAASRFPSLETAPESPREYVAARVRAFQSARLTEADETTPAPRKRRGWGEILGAFLEEKNIRWGELVGGLLIVGCSLALVISFWSSIAQRPWLQFGLFNGVTALLFAVGLHAERRWKLPSTGHGLLMIASLLTPLNFLAVASLDRGAAGGSTLGLIGGIVAAILFGVLLIASGKVLSPNMPWTLAMGVLGPSMAMLASRRLGDPIQSATLPLLTVGLAPWAAQAAAVGRWLIRHPRDSEWDAPTSQNLLRLLGLSSFACALASGLLIALSRDPAIVAQRLAPVFPLAGAPALAAGLALWRRAAASRGVVLQVAGPAIASAGAALALAGPAVGWPEPSSILPASLVGFALLTAVAIRYRLPAAHTVAGIALAAGATVLPGLLQGSLPWSGSTASVSSRAVLGVPAAGLLVGLMIVYALASYGLVRRGQMLTGRALAVVAMLAGLYGIGAAGLHFNAPDGASAPWIMAVAALSLAASSIGFGTHPLLPSSSGRAEASGLGWAASSLALVAFFASFVGQAWIPHEAGPWAWAMLGHSSLLALIALFLGPRAIEGGQPWTRLTTIAERSATFSAVGTAVFLSVRVPFAPPSALAWPLGGLAFTLGATAWRRQSRGLFAGHQAAAVGSILFGVAAWASGRAWHIRSPLPWLDPRMIQAQGLALCVAALLWIALRVFADRLAARPTASPHGLARRLATLMNPPWPPIDRFVRWVSLLGLVALSVYAVLPGSAQELTPRSLARTLAGVSDAGSSRVVPSLSVFEIPGLPHDPARQPATWVLMLMSFAVMLASMAERVRRLDLTGAIVALSMAAPLAASLAEPSVAVASALRWSSMLALLAISALIWTRRPLLRLSSRLGLVNDADSPQDLGGLAATVAISLALLPLLLMGFFVVGAAIWTHGIDPDVRGLWLASGIFFVASAAVALALGRVPENARLGSWLRNAGAVLGLLGCFPVVAVSGFVLASSLSGDPVVGPDAGSFFWRIGLAGSYVPPVILLAATLIGFGLRDREPAYGLASGLLLGLSGVMGYLMAGPASAGVLDSALAVRLSQILGLILALYSACWLALRSNARFASTSEDRADRLLLPCPRPRAQLLSWFLIQLATLLVTGSIALGLISLWSSGWPLPAHEKLGDLGGWAALLSVLLALAAARRFLGWPPRTEIAGGAVVASASLVGFSLAMTRPATYAALHAVGAAQLIAAMFGLALAWSARPRLDSVAIHAVTRWATVAWAITLAISLRELPQADSEPWWCLLGLVGSAALAFPLCVWSGRNAFLGLGTAPLNLAASVFCLVNPFDWSLLQNVGGTDLLSINAIALMLPQIALQPLAEWWDAGRSTPRPTPVARAIDRLGQFSAWLSLGLLALLVWIGIQSVGDQPLRPLAWMGWLALVVVGLGLLLRGVRTGPRGLFPVYLLGLLTVGWTLVVVEVSGEWAIRTGLVLLAVYGLATSFIWSRRSAFAGLVQRLGWSGGALHPQAGPGWLGWANLGLVVLVFVLGAWIVLNDPLLAPRQLVANAMLAQGLTLGFLARGPEAEKLRRATLLVGVAGLAAWMGAWVEPGSPTVLLDRLAVLFSALAAASIGYGLGFSKIGDRAGVWTASARWLLPWLLGLAANSSILLLGFELLDQRSGRLGLSMSDPAVGLVALALLGSAVAALAAAALPGRDPLDLSDDRRSLYVYGAEVLLASLLLHIRLAMPWLFSGWLLRYWPLILMLVAYLGVGLSEFFRRQGRHVLARPLQRTGALLPLFPLLAGIWIKPKAGDDVTFLILTGVLYTTLSALRSSIGFGALAALAFNAALWFVLGRTEGLSLAEHPQLWFIPPALCVLTGTYLVRDLLSEAQFNSIRQGASLAIYLSSTADIILTGVAQAPWLPLVLGALSIAGILSGIWLRVRDFLLLGLGFLGLSIFTMIWYAAVDLRMTWIWAASGIVAGVLILALFALFEKKRQELRHVVDEIRDWNG